MSTVVAAIPVKPFGDAKRRLASVLSVEERAILSRELARRTVEAAAQGGAVPVVLSADDQVTSWAEERGVDVLLDEGSSLNEAATTACRLLAERRSAWMIIHADLPILSPADVAAAVAVVGSGRPVLAPSSDGGTSLVGWDRVIDFSYGPGSFHRHLATLAQADPAILGGAGWWLDLDTEYDLHAARRHTRGGWLGT